MASKEDFVRQSRLVDLIRKYFDGNNDAVVNAISEMTGQSISVRIVQAWQIDPSRVSYRRVPDRALKALEDYVKQPGKEQELKERSARVAKRRAADSLGNEWSDEIRSEKAVEFATQQIEIDMRSRQSWQDAAGKELGNMLFDRFNHMQDQLAGLSKDFGSLLVALDTSTNFVEFKKKADNLMLLNTINRGLIRSAREAIEQKKDDFNGDDKL